MSEINKKNNKGFTLIELLVVIAIIAILSVVVLASINESRERAQNKARNSQVIEYEKALELYKSENPNEGYPSNRRGTSYICLGNDGCHGCDGSFCAVTDDGGINSPTLDEDLQDYIQPWSDNGTVDYSGFNMHGLAYKCIEPSSGGVCEEYSIQWYLVGRDQDCIRGAVSTNLPSSDITYCVYQP
jgi:prepilin-type N-terminal cleavage/methylation domain-containing protein